MATIKSDLIFPEQDGASDPPADTSRSDESVDLRIAGSQRGQPFTFCFAGREIRAYEGETIAAALLAAGVRQFRQTSGRGAQRGMFCNMGVCYDCLVEIDGRLNRRACREVASPQMTVNPHRGFDGHDATIEPKIVGEQEPQS